MSVLFCVFRVFSVYSVIKALKANHGMHRKDTEHTEKNLFLAVLVVPKFKAASLFHYTNKD